MSAIKEYRTLLDNLVGSAGLQAASAAHYSGSFGFQSLSIRTSALGQSSSEGQLEAIEAHEAFHGVQAFTLGSVREIFRAFQQLARFRFLHMALLVQHSVRIPLGKIIFEVYLDQPLADARTAERLISDACRTINAAFDIRHGVSVMGLIEGSACAVEAINASDDPASILDTAPPLYRQAWMLYRKVGGTDARTFAQLCSAALRYGSVDPHFSDHYPHPTEVFTYLLNFVHWFESYMTDTGGTEPDYTAFTPPGDYDEDGPIRAGKSQEYLNDIPRIETSEHFFPDDMFEPDVEEALASYKSTDRSQLQTQDKMFGVSMAIASALESGYVRVAEPVDPGKSTQGRQMLDLIQKQVFEWLPGLHIEEVFIHSLVNRDFQRHVADVFKNQVSTLLVHPWTGADADKEIPHSELIALLQLAEDVDHMSLAQAYLASGDEVGAELSAQYQPRCCPHHADLRDFDQITACGNTGSINRNFGETFGVDLADFLKGSA